MSMKTWLALLMSLVLATSAVACTTPAETPGEDQPVAEEGDAEGEMEGEEGDAEGEDAAEGDAEGEMDEEADDAEAEDDAMAPTDRTGAWLDQLVVVQEPDSDRAVTRLEAGDIDVFAFPVSSPGTYEKILETDGIDYKTSYGSYNEITFNPAACADESTLNPFSSPRVREAMNWLVDRDYIVEEIMGGLGTPRYVPINGASADRGRLAAEIRAIEAAYAYDPEQAEAVITEEMEALGAEQGEDGTWTFNGEPVEITGIIRTEDERQQIGDYVAGQLEDIGFTVIRDYKTSAEAAPIWQQSEPSECLFGYYTGGWVSTQINRDASTNFNFFYTPSGLARPLWQAYTPTEEFAEIAQRLNDSDFTSLEERTQLFAEALPLALQDSVRIWLLDRSSVAPLRDDMETASDLSGSIYGTNLWPYTLRRVGEEGGEATWASASILTEPWNPIAGTNWIYDSTLYRATGQFPAMADPNTGLNLPQRIESFEVTVQEDLPVGSTLDWVELNTEPEIVVPEDAWVDWDAESQTWITAADFYTETATAALRATTTYPADLFETISWHDGSPLSPADMVMSLIMNFDVAKEASAVYDEAQVAALDSFMSTFKGMRILSTDPFTIEFYTDNWSLDAENALTNLRAAWPQYGFGEAPWHTIAIGVATDAAGQAAFSADKSTANEVEQLNYIAGPTLALMEEQLTAAAEAGTIPYEATLSEYITAEEAAERYANAQAWYADKEHFWIGTGPFMLEEAYPVEGNIVLTRNEAFPDPSDKWAQFSEPAIAEVTVDGPGRVAAGESATFDVLVDYNGDPYAQDDVDEVKYLVFDATGEMIADGTAEGVSDGQWQVTLDETVTSGLEAGSNRLEVIVVSQLVALPSLGALEFVSTP